MKVKNKGDIGNPNHDEEGKFTTADNVAESNDDDVGVFALEFNLDDINSFLDSIDATVAEDNTKKAQETIDVISNTEYVNKVFYDSLSTEEKRDLLLKSTQEYDESKLEKLTEDEINALLYAESVLNHKRKLEQELLLSEKERAKLNNSFDKKDSELQKTFYPSGSNILSGIWMFPINPAMYLEKKQAVDENGQNAIDRKRLYFEDIINDPLSFENDINEAQDKLNRLNEYVDRTEKYFAEYTKLKQDVGIKLADIEASINAQRLVLKNLSENQDYLKAAQLSKDFIGKYQDKNAPYSQFRKDNAIWFKSGDKFEISKQATKYFGPKFEKMWNNIPYNEQQQLIDYTGGGYSKYNKPLRGINHSGWSGFNFSKAITNLTNAIEKCEWEDDIWVQRGIDDTKLFILPGTSDARLLGSMSDKELNSLVGTSFKDNGFYSAGAGKNTGFTLSQIIFNTYCPKGTKMAYMNTKGIYANSIENEMVLQRGYSYRITKVEKAKGKIFIDCEVILGSNDDKIVDMNKLTAIGKKYLN